MITPGPSEETLKRLGSRQVQKLLGMKLHESHESPPPSSMDVPANGLPFQFSNPAFCILLPFIPAANMPYLICKGNKGSIVKHLVLEFQRLLFMTVTLAVEVVPLEA